MKLKKRRSESRLGHGECSSIPSRSKPLAITIKMAELSLKILSSSQQLSAYSFLSFLTIHLSAPIVAAFAPPHQAELSASRIMLLGREWYQNGISEFIFVWGALGIHICSGVLVRGLKVAQTKKRRQKRRRDAKAAAEQGLKDEDSLPILHDIVEDEELEMEHLSVVESPPSSHQQKRLDDTFPTLPTFQRIAGYILIPLTLSHARLHRLLPSSASAPISSLSPTLFSYSFVSWSLSPSSPFRRRLLSTISYSALVSLAVYHALVGIRIYTDSKAPRSLRSKDNRPPVWSGSYGGVVVAAGIGLARLAAEGGQVPLWMGRKYEAVWARA